MLWRWGHVISARRIGGSRISWNRSYGNLRGMAIDVASGLFALGGVALAGAWAEIRAGREARARQSSELVSLKRELYSEAILRTEAVASSVAQWVAAEDDASQQAVWAALTSAYETAGRIRIVADTQVPAEAMRQLLAVYRNALESEDRRLPKPSDFRDEMISEFRKDLGRPDN